MREPTPWQFMQVIILPVHDGLNDPVKARQGVISGHLDAAPDCRSNFGKRQAELKNPFNACHLSDPLLNGGSPMLPPAGNSALRIYLA
jgi:hypothetical protein